MKARQWIVFLGFSVLFVSAGVAQASDIDIQTGSTRVRFGADGSVRINARQVGLATRPEQLRSSIYQRRNSVLSNSRISCRGFSDSYQSSRTSRISGSRTYMRSSTSTRVCQ
ncbi:MAG: hypothetical protein F6K19_35705 [Cyanothece sp. SIO1E1]|nr:hypothetical protein [Cyanothece sp. SIO1E1]